MNEYDGEERRSRDRDHDVLTRIDVNLSNFMSRFKEHVKGNNDDFISVKTRLGRVEKWFWMGLGAFVVLQFLFKIIAHSMTR